MNEMRIVLVGKTGVGKSGLGNSLLMNNHFVSSPMECSVTHACKFGARKLEDGTNLVIVDTPGIFDKFKSDYEKYSEFVRCIELSSPGPHAFFFVLKIGLRFTEEEMNKINWLKDMFGKQVMRFVTVVFTGKDSLEQRKISLDEYVRRAPLGLIQLIQDCNGCYAAINNIAKPDEKEKDVQEMLNLVRKTMERNRGMHYTGKMYEEAEKRFEERLRLLEEEKHKKKRELEQKEKKLVKSSANMKKTLAKQKGALEDKQRQLDLKAKRKEEKFALETERVNKRRLKEELELQRRREELEEAQREIQKERDRDSKEREEERRKFEKKREDELRVIAEQTKKLEEAQREIQEERVI